MPVCLTIAGLDPSGGAGVIADIKAFRAFGCFGAAVVTSLTFQNTTGVFGAEHISAENVLRQAEPVFDDYTVAAVKTGMLPSGETVKTVSRLFAERGVTELIVDPVVRSTSGFDLIDDGTLKVLIRELFPLARLVTPNIPEAERITGIKIVDKESMEKAGRSIRSMGAENVLIKGGHAIQTDDDQRAIDTLFANDGVHSFEADLIRTTATHGTGCTLSAAIAANLALGRSLEEAVDLSKQFVKEAIRQAPGLGHGHSPILA